jgi:hypothetical protein
MPIQHAPNIRWGSTGRLHLLFARDAAGSSRGISGLRHDSPGAAAAYVREGEAPRSIALSSGRLGTWTPGGFVEVDPELMAGVYQLGIPDEVLAEGSTRAVLHLRFDGAWIDPIDIELVAYDPLDEFSIGIEELQNKTRHKFLHRAMPGVTEDTLDRGEDTERQLTARLRGATSTGGGD